MATKKSETTSRSAQPSFEEAVEELESIIQLLEANQVPLEQSLEAYKRGTNLLKHCQTTLNDVEQQVRILNESQQLQTYTEQHD